MAVNPEINSDEKNLALLAHLLGIFTGFVGALVIWLIASEKPFAKQQAQEALNFQITVLIAYIASGILSVIGVGFLITSAVWVVNLIFCIMGTMAVSKGQGYTYPFALRLIK
ncbi:MAG TPA: DUF4870 domain-containing protein [Armatimonadota bacterium]|jgi:hypothetical protein